MPPKPKKGKGKKTKKPTPVQKEPEFVFAAEPGDNVLPPSSIPWRERVEGEVSAPSKRLQAHVPPVHPVHPGVIEAEEELDRLRNEILGDTGSSLLAAVSPLHVVCTRRPKASLTADRINLTFTPVANLASGLSPRCRKRCMAVNRRKIRRTSSEKRRL